jgi:hypothetical protein
MSRIDPIEDAYNRVVSELAAGIVSRAPKEIARIVMAAGRNPSNLEADIARARAGRFVQSHARPRPRVSSGSATAAYLGRKVESSAPKLKSLFGEPSQPQSSWGPNDCHPIKEQARQR